MNFLPLTRRARIADAIKLVAAEYDLTADDLRGRGRTHHVALVRHFAMWVARRATSMSLSVIGREFGGRDHSTVLYGLTRVEGIRQRDTLVASALDRISQRVWDMAPLRHAPVVEEIIASTPQLRPTRISATISADLIGWMNLGGTFERGTTQRGTFEVAA